MKESETFTVAPKETILISSFEKIEMPKSHDISALVVSKITISAKGLINVTTTIDADWCGTLLLVFHNSTNHKIELTSGMAICTVIFFENRMASTKPSSKNDGRNDVLVETWNQKNMKAKNRSFITSLIPVIIIGTGFLTGYLFFGNSTALIASVSLGIAISQIISRYVS